MMLTLIAVAGPIFYLLIGAWIVSRLKLAAPLGWEQALKQTIFVLCWPGVLIGLAIYHLYHVLRDRLL